MLEKCTCWLYYSIKDIFPSIHAFIYFASNENMPHSYFFFYTRHLAIGNSLLMRMKNRCYRLSLTEAFNQTHVNMLCVQRPNPAPSPISGNLYPPWCDFTGQNIWYLHYQSKVWTHNEKVCPNVWLVVYLHGAQHALFVVWIKKKKYIGFISQKTM